MQKKEYTVLLIDDHPIITDGYKSAFHYIAKYNEELSFHIEVAQNCDMADQKIDYLTSGGRNLDIVFLDICLPPSKDGQIVSGEDLGLKIKEQSPNTKIVVSTTFNDNYRLHSIFKNIDPDGFITKNDLSAKKLVDAINTVLNEPPYYSKTVIRLLRKEVSSDFILDKIDRKLLYELSIGTMMKELPEILFLSLPAIEKRKNHLKQIFDVSGLHDKELILKAKEKGFI